MTMPISYRSYAKVNLYLDILARRRDGYHNIETIFQSVSLYDEISFVDRPNGISLDCSAPELQSIDMNLACRAARLLADRTGCTLGVHIQIKKNVPIAAGLAGGSGNAAATLVGLNQLWSLHLSPAQLWDLALELGSDVPYCLVGGAMGATGRGEQLFPLSPLGRVWFVLIHPAMAVSSSRVYNSPNLVRNNAPRFAGKTATFRKALRAFQGGDWPKLVFNRMEEPVFADHSYLAEVKERLRGAGCLAAAMSGSGSTLFGVCATKRDAAKVAAALGDVPTSTVRPTAVAVERAE